MGWLFNKKPSDIIKKNRSKYLSSPQPYQLFLPDLYSASYKKIKEWNLSFDYSQELLAFDCFVVSLIAAPYDIADQVENALSTINIATEKKDFVFINKRIQFYNDVFEGKTHPEPKDPQNKDSFFEIYARMKYNILVRPSLLEAIANDEFEKDVLSDPFSRTFIAFGNIVFRKNQAALPSNYTYFIHSFPTTYFTFPPFISDCLSLSGLFDRATETSDHEKSKSNEKYGELFGALFLCISQALSEMEFKGDPKTETLAFLYFMFDCMAFKSGKDQDQLWKEIANCVECLFPDDNHTALYEKMHDRAMLYAHITNKQIRPNNGYYPPIDEDNRHFFKYAWFAYGGILKDPASADYLLDFSAPLLVRPINETLEFSVLWTSIFQVVIEGVHDSGLFYND